MAIGVIGGVITSTFLTLFVVPLVFAVFEKLTPPSMRIKKTVDETTPKADETTRIVPTPGLAAKHDEVHGAAARPV